MKQILFILLIAQPFLGFSQSRKINFEKIIFMSQSGYVAPLSSYFDRLTIDGNRKITVERKLASDTVVECLTGVASTALFDKLANFLTPPKIQKINSNDPMMTDGDAASITIYYTGTEKNITIYSGGTPVPKSTQDLLSILYEIEDSSELQLQKTAKFQY